MLIVHGDKIKDIEDENLKQKVSFYQNFSTLQGILEKNPQKKSPLEKSLGKKNIRKKDPREKRSQNASFLQFGMCGSEYADKILGKKLHEKKSSEKWSPVKEVPEKSFSVEGMTRKFTEASLTIYFYFY